jgi:hypothetical protein
MIKGIANRLGLRWGLSDRWAAEAREAIASIDTPAEVLPIWSVVPPTVATTDASASGASSVRLVAGKDRIRFADVMKSFVGCARLLRSYVTAKLTALVRKYVPESTLRKVLRFALRASAILKGEKLDIPAAKGVEVEGSTGSSSQTGGNEDAPNNDTKELAAATA